MRPPSLINNDLFLYLVRTIFNYVGIKGTYKNVSNNEVNLLLQEKYYVYSNSL